MDKNDPIYLAALEIVNATYENNYTNKSINSSIVKLREVMGFCKECGGARVLSKQNNKCNCIRNLILNSTINSYDHNENHIDDSDFDPDYKRDAKVNGDR